MLIAKRNPNSAQNFLDHDKKYKKSTHLYSNFICTLSVQDDDRLTLKEQKISSQNQPTQISCAENKTHLMISVCRFHFPFSFKLKMASTKFFF